MREAQPWWLGLSVAVLIVTGCAGRHARDIWFGMNGLLDLRG
jgi:hypothetical protein